LGALTHSLAAAALGLALAACSSWPPASRGGAAERGGRAVPATGADPAMVARMGCSLARFRSIQDFALDRQQLTGRVAAAGEIAVRAQREVHGGLTADGAATLDLLDAETVAIAAALPGAPSGTPPECQ
jgi:hypothetical protein